jgi:beta propeller repeat protein
MKTDKIHSKALASAAVILFLILVSSTVSATAGSPNITETRITNNTGSIGVGKPAIYGNLIAWEDTRNGNWNVFMYDLSTNKETQISKVKSDQELPAIYGDRIVWWDDRNGVGDLYMRNLSTSTETRITTPPSRPMVKEVIYGDRIAWTDGRNGKYDVYMYDLANSNVTQITNSGSASDPAIYKNRIVWKDYLNGSYCIYMHDFSTKKETQITNHAMYDNDPAIYGDRIVWSDSRNGLGSPDIYMYDLSTKKETRITTHGSVYSYTPSIYENNIVWVDGRNGNTDIYMYNISTSKETQITKNVIIYDSPVIYSNKILWTNEYDIYVTTIGYSQVPIAAFSACPISGKAPLKVQFNDKSTGSPTSWEWNFGDCTKSTAKNPVHKYTKAGKYTVTLTVKNSAGSNTAKTTKYITVK